MMNPILASGARRRMRSAKTPLLFTLFYALLMVIVYVFGLREVSGDTLTIGSMMYGAYAYVGLVAVQFVLLLLIAPIMTAGSIAGERERQTLELLLVTNTGSLRIVTGKLMENFCYLALLVFSSLPLMCVSVLFGSITLVQALEGIAFLLVTALAALSVGLFCSALCKRTVAATIVTYLLLLAIGVGTLVTGLFFMSRTVTELSTSDANLAQILLASTPQQLASMLPKVILINPGVGLLTLLAEHTGIIDSFMYSIMGYGMYNVLIRLSMRAVTYWNMGLLLGGSTIFCLAGAMLVRPRRNAVRRQKKRRA